jgi:hypothetical protein
MTAMNRAGRIAFLVTLLAALLVSPAGAGGSDAEESRAATDPYWRDPGRVIPSDRILKSLRTCG